MPAYTMWCFRLQSTGISLLCSRSVKSGPSRHTMHRLHSGAMHASGQPQSNHIPLSREQIHAHLPECGVILCRALCSLNVIVVWHHVSVFPSLPV